MLLLKINHSSQICRNQQDAYLGVRSTNMYYFARVMTTKVTILNYAIRPNGT